MVCYWFAHFTRDPVRIFGTFLFIRWVSSAAYLTVSAYSRAPLFKKRSDPPVTARLLHSADQSGLCILPRSQPMPMATSAVVYGWVSIVFRSHLSNVAAVS
jgi:hypothetical protein